MNKIAFRIAGLFALLANIVFLYIHASGLSKIATIQNFMYQVINLAVTCIGLYGGFQLMKLRKIGHQLLIIWILCRISWSVIAVLGFAFDFSGSIQFVTGEPILKQFLTAYYLLSPVVLVYLLASKTSKELTADENSSHTHALLQLLSLLTPGLARALVSNLVIGVILFYVFSGLMIYSKVNLNFEANLPNFYFTNSQLTDFFVNLLDKIVIWAIFARFDWEVIKNYKISTQQKPISDLQVNGG